MQIITGRIDEYGCDWLSLSQVIRAGSNGRSELWEAVVNGLMPVCGGEPRQVKFGGYRGWSFDNGKPQKIGQRQRDGNIDVLYQCHGDRADYMANWFDKRGLLNADGIRCTRFDEQVTVIADIKYECLVSDFYEAIVVSKIEGASLTGRRKATLYRSDGGDTLYVGSRSSKGNLYRIYDKSSKYGLPKGSAWRFEVERGQRTAQGGLEYYLSDADERDKLASLSADLTANVGLSYHVHCEGWVPGQISSVHQQKADDDRTLDWLERCVRGPVWRLVNNGRRDSVISALDLHSWD